MSQISVIATSEFSRPRTNFGPRWTSRNDEELFARSFTAAYDRKFNWFHTGSSKLARFFVLEVPVQGLGIADMIALSWDNRDDAPLPANDWDADQLLSLDPTIRAFEVKLSDWRRGLMQAHRYRFFADAAILVMPDSKRHLVEPFLPTFQSVNVGFWTFNNSTEAINKVYTPRPKRPALIAQRRKAAAGLWKTITQGRQAS